MGHRTRAVALWLALVASSACRHDAGGVAKAPPRAATGVAATWTYDVALEPSGRALAIDATYGAGVGGELVVGNGAAQWLSDLAIADPRGAFRPATQADLGVCARLGCSMRYRFDVDAAARAVGDKDSAVSLADGAFESPPSTWLLRPDRVPPGATYALRLRAPNGAVLATGLRQRGAASALDDAPYAAIGAFRVRHVEVGGGAFDIAIASARYAMSDDAIAAWVRDAAATLSDYLDGFPVPRTLIVLGPSRGRGVNGSAMGGGGASVLVELGALTTAERAREDWVLTHELVHVATPTVGHPHRWMEEGLATYLEPVVRARAGLVDAGTFWRELAEGVKQGLPGLGDEGLDHTPTWGRTYWGGALFWLLADVEIRDRTGNARSLDVALRALCREGLTGEHPTEVGRVIAVADAAVGVPVMRRLYDELALAPGRPDLEALFLRLGVGAKLDDRAPLAAIRRAITAAKPR